LLEVVRDFIDRNYIAFSPARTAHTVIHRETVSLACWTDRHPAGSIFKKALPITVPAVITLFGDGAHSIALAACVPLRHSIRHENSPCSDRSTKANHQCITFEYFFTIIQGASKMNVSISRQKTNASLYRDEFVNKKNAAICDPYGGVSASLFEQSMVLSG
jgi:hypothetical protein